MGLWRWGLGWVAVVLLLGGGVGSAGESFQAKVVEVMDGDTVGALRTDTRAHVKIRLAEIDAPEKSQPFGNQSKKSLSELVFGKVIRVDVADTDRYGRLVARLYDGKTDVNAEQVRRGMAWVYRRYNRDPAFPPLETAARAAKRGLWADAERLAPWDYRHGTKGASSKAAAPTAGGGAARCGPKRYCSQMTDCAEARRYLACGLASLDRDGDGVPCEALCR